MVACLLADTAALAVESVSEADEERANAGEDEAKDTGDETPGDSKDTGNNALHSKEKAAQDIDDEVDGEVEEEQGGFTCVRRRL